MLPPKLQVRNLSIPKQLPQNAFSRRLIFPQFTSPLLEPRKIISTPIIHSLLPLGEGLGVSVFHAFCTSPWIPELVVRKEAPSPGIRSIRNHTKGVVFEKLGDVAFVTVCDLIVGVPNGRLLADGALEFKDDQGQAVDVENAVGDAFLVAGDLKLIDDLEEVVAGAVGGFVLRDDGGHLVGGRFAKGDQPGVVEQLDVEILLGVVFALQEEAVADQLHDRLVALVEIGGGVGFELVDDRIDFLRRDAVGGVLLGEEGTKVGMQQNLPWLSGDRLSLDVRITLLTQEFNDGCFQGSFAEF